MNKFKQFVSHIPKDEWDKMTEEAQKVAINQIVAFEVVVGENKSYLLPIGNKEGFKRSSYNVLSNYIHGFLSNKTVAMASVYDKMAIFEAIVKLENYTPSSHIMKADAKLKGKNWSILNSDSGITCVNRSNGRCKFCNDCYAFKACRYPNPTLKQLYKALFFHLNDVEAISNVLQQRGSPVCRINQEGEFNTLNDFLKVVELATNNPNVSFYGYTKNLEVLEHIETQGLPNNLVINNSLGTWSTTNYLAIKQDKVVDYLKNGYLLCKGACGTCKQCLTKKNKVTILRDGSETVDVKDLKGLSQKDLISYFEGLEG